MRKVIRLLAVTTLALTLALPITSYAGTWRQDTAGWRVQSDDGVYLTNQWYQSPESKLWYYIGENGYMLTNTYTPDGYFVNADGVWVQSVPQEPIQESQPVEQPTQSNRTDGLAPGALSKEEVDRRAEEAGLGGTAHGEVLDPSRLSGGPNAGRGYNWGS